MREKLEKLMDRHVLTILTVNYNTSDFIGLMLYALHKLTKNPYKVVICDNGSNNAQILKLTNIVKKYSDVECIFRIQSKQGSVGHAEAMDLLISKVNTRYFVTMDSDAVPLLKNWDEVLIKNIDDKVKIIGTPADPPILGMTTNKLQDFPRVFCVLYETKTYKDLGCSYMPDKSNDFIEFDTGFTIREKYLNAGFSGKIFLVKNTRIYKDGCFPNCVCNEYYYAIDDKKQLLIASHFGRGALGGAPKYLKKLKIPILGQGLKKLIASKEKRKWIDICYKIITDSENLIEHKFV